MYTPVMDKWYQELRPTFEKIATLIITEIQKRGLQEEELAKELAIEEGLKESSGFEYIHNIKRGLIHGGNSSVCYETGRHIPRLSRFLYIIGLDEDHPIIIQIKQVEPRFDYPPKDKGKLGEKKKEFKDITSKLIKLDLKDLRKVNSYLDEYLIKQ